MEDALLAQLQNSSLDDGEKGERRLGDNDSDVSDDGGKQDDHDHSSSATNATMMRQGGRQTGPKGVIDDQKYQQQMDASKKRGQIADYNAKLLARAPMTTTYLQDQQQQQQIELVLESRSENQDRSKQQVLKDDGDNLEDAADSDDEEAIKAYRENRLAELKRMRHHTTRQDHRVFGTVQQVDVDDYATVIDDEWRTVPVIVHLYDDTLEHCRQLDVILQGLARKYCLAKIIRVSALDLEFDLVGSPAILGYKDGILVANLVRLDDEVGSRYTAEAVEDVLVRHEVLSEDDQYDTPKREHAGSGDVDDYDDE
ncbi:thioredoxin-like protein [Absidia repens]|uniref:Thioredoxin-like protein n=1 Tax=Absidia repens TaxID=90262 RepID=A0A1X2I6C2_9FUNG|nr:thioredoxin-like protein [Absidia repens]